MGGTGWVGGGGVQGGQVVSHKGRLTVPSGLGVIIKVPRT